MRQRGLGGSSGEGVEITRITSVVSTYFGCLWIGRGRVTQRQMVVVANAGTNTGTNAVVGSGEEPLGGLAELSWAAEPV